MAGARAWIIILATAFVTLAVLGLLARAILAPASPPPGVAFATIGKAALAYAPDYARSAADRQGGKLDRLDLAASFPEFRPAGRLSNIKADEDLARRTERMVFLALTPDDGSLDPADRPIHLYETLLDPIGYRHPGGLVRRRFTAESPYAGEELYMAPPEGRVFWARCSSQPPPQPGQSPESCITELRVAGMDVTARFSPALLPEWEQLIGGVRGLLKAIIR